MFSRLAAVLVLVVRDKSGGVFPRAIKWISAVLSDFLEDHLQFGG